MKVTKITSRGWLRRGDGLAVQRGDKYNGLSVLSVIPPNDGWSYGEWQYTLTDKEINWSRGEKRNSVYGDFVITTWDCGCQHISGNLDHKAKTFLCGEHTKLPPRRHRNIF